MLNIKYAAYKLCKTGLPRPLYEAIGKSKISEFARSILFRPAGKEETTEGIVQWQGSQFYFKAPYKVFYKAQRSGIENRICRLGRLAIRYGGTALDVGANYGFVTMTLGKCAHPGTRVIAFEIDPDVCYTLRQTIEENDLSNVVTLISQGAGSRNADELVTVDSVVKSLKLENIRFIKIDVDGGDFQVLQGASDTLRSFHPVVVIEMTESQQEIYDFLIGAGYKHFIDQSNNTVISDAWPANLIASVEEILIPAKGPPN